MMSRELSAKKPAAMTAREASASKPPLSAVVTPSGSKASLKSGGGASVAGGSRANSGVVATGAQPVFTVASTPFRLLSEHETILTAVRAVFVQKESTSIHPHLEELIALRDDKMLQTVKRYKHAIEGSIEELRASKEKLETVGKTASKTLELTANLTEGIGKAHEEALKWQRIAKNSGDCLDILLKVQRLLKLFSVAQEAVDRGKMHVALRCLDIFKKELDQATLRGSSEFIPAIIPTGVTIRNQVQAHVDLLFRRWLAHLGEITLPIGQYAVGVSDENPGWLPNAIEYIEEAAELSDGTSTDLENPAETLFNAQSPPIPVRDFLTCCQLHGDMNSSAEFKREYAERRRTLLEASSQWRNDADLATIETTIAAVVGFFVVERSVEQYCVPPADASTRSMFVSFTDAEVQDVWLHCQTKLLAALSGLKLAAENALAKAKVRSLVEKTAKCMRGYGLATEKLDSWV